MSTHSAVATVLTHLPKQYVTEAHRLALSACNVAVVDTTDPELLYLYTRDGEGPQELQLNANLPFDDFWADFLEDTGLDECADDPFVATLRECLTRGDVDWSQVLQLVLCEIPEDALSHIDVQGSYWCDKERPGEFGGFAFRVTRTNVHVQEGDWQFFQRLDRLGRGKEQPLSVITDSVIDTVLRSATGLAGVLALAFPERPADAGEPAAERAALEAALQEYVAAWSAPAPAVGS